MRDVVICEPVRTAVGGFGGAYKTVHAHELASHVIRELMARTSVPARNAIRPWKHRPSGGWWRWMPG